MTDKEKIEATLAAIPPEDRKNVMSCDVLEDGTVMTCFIAREPPSIFLKDETK